MTQIETLTAQQVFDTAAIHLITQGVPSHEEGKRSECLYRGPNGTKCAVGAMITDEEYSPDMEGTSVFGLRLPNRLVPFKPILSDLQAIHDKHDPDEWKSRLHMLADEYGLNTEAL